MQITLSHIIGLCLGAFTGIYIAVILIIINLKKKLVNSSQSKLADGIDDDTKRDINLIIKDSQDSFKRYTKSKVWHKLLWFTKKRPLVHEPVNYEKMIEDIATVFNPTSKSPIYELSTKQLFALFKVVIEKLERILENMNLPFINNISISSILTSTKIFKQFLRKEFIMKNASRISIIIKVINFINPLYWVKRFIQETVTANLFAEIHRLVIEIIGIEFANLYSEVDISLNSQQPLTEITELDKAEKQAERLELATTDLIEI